MNIKSVFLLLSLFINGGAFSQHSLKVDLASPLRPVTHCASGSLYGITESLPGDIESLVAPLKPYMFCQPPRGKVGDQHPFGSAIVVSERLQGTTGVVQIQLPDLLPGWPYRWPGLDVWLAEVESVVKDKIASGRNNYHSYNIWNEPQLTWLDSYGDFYTDCWKPTFDLIRSLDPAAKIVGPGDAYFTFERMTSFLTFCKNNNCLPDMICWHELGGSNYITAHVRDYRIVEKNVGVAELPICINEYCHPTRANEGCPGTSAPFIAKFERNKIESACYSWWFTNLPGRLGSLLTENNEKGGGWWFYKWYGDMTGTMVSVTPPVEQSDGLDGFACLDEDAQYASICFGGNNTGTVDVQINGLPEAFGSTVNVAVEYIPWEGKDIPVAGPVTMASGLYEVVDGAISVPVEVASQLYGYRVLVRSVDSRPEISIVSPSIPAQFVEPANVVVDVSAGDPDGTVEHIDFYRNGELFHSEYIAPYAFTMDDLAAGKYTIKAVAFDNDGNTAEDSILIRVNVPQASFNSSPHQIPGVIQLEEFDHGGNGFAYFDSTEGSETGVDYRSDEDVDIEACSDSLGGYNIGWAMSGEWLEYTVDIKTAGFYRFMLRASCNGDGRMVSFAVNDSVVLPDLSVPNTQGWQNWADVVADSVMLEKGIQVAKLAIGAVDFVNLNYIDLSLIVKPTDPILLTKGWNLIGSPVNGSIGVLRALSDIEEHVLIVKDFDGFLDTSIPPQFHSLSQFQWGKGYFIKVDADCMFRWPDE